MDPGVIMPRPRGQGKPAPRRRRTPVARRQTSVGLLVAAAALAAAGCARSPGDPALVTYTSPRWGFTLLRPSRWSTLETDGGHRVWFLPRPLPEGETPDASATEFIQVLTRDDPGPLPEPEVRRLAMTLLPMHGVSGFQRTERSTERVAWYHFELTGSTRGREWASVGLLVTGPGRFHYLVCAAPLGEWRTRQRLCDRVVRSFAPGGLQRP
jgi:hypothetical protein